jgi:hypothetical protein
MEQELHIEFCRERWEDNIKMDMREIASADMNCTELENFDINNFEPLGSVTRELITLDIPEG